MYAGTHNLSVLSSTLVAATIAKSHQAAQISRQRSGARTLTIQTMAVDRNHVPDIIDPDRAGRLCRELQLAGVEPMLTSTNDGHRTTGVALTIDAGAVHSSGAAAAQFGRQAFDSLAQDLPISVAVTNPGGIADAIGRFRNLCEILRTTMNDAGASPASVELLIEAGSMSPQTAWLLRCELLGDGILHMIAPRSLMRPDDTAVEKSHHDRFWLEVWRLRRNAFVRVLCAPFVLPQCPLLSIEPATDVLPSVSLQAPRGSAWIPLQLDLSRFVDDKGVFRETALEQALCRCVEAGDLLHDLARWPTAQMRHDSWLNRRLAIILSGFGDIAQRRGYDPARFASLAELSEDLRWVENILRRQSQAIAKRTQSLPALEQSDPTRALPAGATIDGWRERWQHAAEFAAHRHRNLVAMSPWSVFPSAQAADYRYADLLPLLDFAHVLSFTNAPPIAGWNASKLKSFYQRAWAVLEARSVTQQIAEEP